ncbi:universal stress protein [Kribbella sp. NPDC023972]|uniref:universal stress protein n=1 Tax=Kribbella sp. NPDC023972 TaxID=3154795 RepID=UPI0033ED8976
MSGTPVPWTRGGSDGRRHARLADLCGRGVDGSEHSRRALEWAAGEARLRGAVLRIVYALPIGLTRSGGPDPHVDAAARGLADLAALARQLDRRPLTVTNDIVDGLPVKVLIEESRHCALLVLGSRGHGGFANLLLGSTAVEVTARTACPVVVVPPGADVRNRSGAVVVGVDDSTGCESALEFAFARAAQRRARLVALQVWNLPRQFSGHSTADVDRVRSDSESLLARAVIPWQDRFPDVIVETRSIEGHVVAELAAVSAAGGEVVVVGGRGRSVVAGAFLGSVSQGLLRHAVVPVAIAR